jgi:cytochrome b involved in lipid metabolism
MNRKIYAVLLIAIVAVVMVSGCTTTGNGDANGGNGDNSGNGGTNVQTYSPSQIAEHDSSDDCWIVVQDKVYDVTAFINSHPGGEAILQGCGTDATELYATRPMGSGTPHSNRANNLLQAYLIGELDTGA